MYSELVSCQHVYLIVLDLYNLPMHFAIKVTPWYLRWSTYARTVEEARASSTGSGGGAAASARLLDGANGGAALARASSTGPGSGAAAGAPLLDGAERTSGDWCVPPRRRRAEERCPARAPPRRAWRQRSGGRRVRQAERWLVPWRMAPPLCHGGQRSSAGGSQRQWSKELKEGLRRIAHPNGY